MPLSSGHLITILVEIIGVEILSLFNVNICKNLLLLLSLLVGGVQFFLSFHHHLLYINFFGNRLVLLATSQLEA